MSSLFPHDHLLAGAFAPAQHPHSNVLAEFKAGKLERDGGTMRPDLRKGIIRIERSDDDLTHFLWRERTSAEAEVDMIVFPAEAKLSRLPAARCYALRFEGQSGRDLFFWMQEPKAAEDEARVSAANSALGATPDEPALPPHAGMAGGETPAPAPRPAVAATPMSAVAATPAVELSAPSSAAPAAPHKAPAAANPAATPVGRVGMGDLQAILSGMGMPSPSGAPSAAAVAASALAQALMSAGAGARGADSNASLSDVLTPEVLLPVLASEGVQERLAPFLPEAHRNSSALAELISSPQFSSQLQSFSRALQSGQIDLQQFGLRAAGGASIADFLQEIQNATPAAAQDDAPKPPADGDDMQQ